MDLEAGTLRERERATWERWLRETQEERNTARAELVAARAETERLNTLLDAAHGLICNAHRKRVDDVTEEDGASPGWAAAARRWIDAYPSGDLDAAPAATSGEA